MVTITFPKNLTLPQKPLQEFFAVPRKEYEEFEVWRNTPKEKSKEFIPTAREKQTLARARENFAKGKYFTLKERRSKENLSANFLLQ